MFMRGLIKVSVFILQGEKFKLTTRAIKNLEVSRNEARTIILCQSSNIFHKCRISRWLDLHVTGLLVVYVHCCYLDCRYKSFV